MGRARQIASAENMDRILLDASAASTDEGEHLLLDASAAGTDVGFFITTEVGTTEVPVNNGVSTEHITTNAITSAKIIDDAITTDKLDIVSQSMTNRNVIENGAMNIAQRGTVTGIGGATGNVYTLDRFGIFDAATAGRVTVAQDSDAPPGFQNSLKISCTTADTSIAAGELLQLNQRIEGQNLQRFKKGTSDARSFVLSFFCKANSPVTYVAELFDIDNSRHVGRTFQVGTTFSRVEINFGADTTGAFGDDANRSLDVGIILHAGTTFNAAALQTTWGAEDTDARAAGANSVVSSTDNTFFITGMQLEAGDTAGTSNPTEFDHEPFQSSLKKCQRYFETGFVQIYGGSPNATAYAPDLQCPYNFKVTKRAVPTITTSNSGSTRGSVAVGPNIKTDGFSMQLDVTDASTPVAGGNFDFVATSDL